MPSGHDQPDEAVQRCPVDENAPFRQAPTATSRSASSSTPWDFFAAAFHLELLARLHALQPESGGLWRPIR